MSLGARLPSSDPTPATTATLPERPRLHTSHPWPTPEQQQSIRSLLLVDDVHLLAGLDLLRSSTAQWTDHQLQALACLRSAPDDYIRDWLAVGRRLSASTGSERSSCFSNLSDSRFSIASTSTTASSLSVQSLIPQFAATPGNLDSIDHSENYNSSQNNKTTPDLNKPLPPGVPKSQQESHADIHRARHERFCSTREHKTPYTTYGGFAKHENEHDSTYVFLPNGPVEDTEWGSQCALCYLKSPSEEHLEKSHGILKYYGWQGQPKTRSRKGNFEELLRKHKTPEQHIRALTEKWRKVEEKQAYSCGFCVSLFKTLPERSSHLDCEHFFKNQRMEEWNENFVIKGLLLQPDIHEVCSKLFKVDPSLVESKVSWPPQKVGDLRLRLELRKEPAADLARDVFRDAYHRPPAPQRPRTAEGFPQVQMNVADQRRSDFSTGYMAHNTFSQTPAAQSQQVPPPEPVHHLAQQSAESLLAQSSPLNALHLDPMDVTNPYPMRSSSRNTTIQAQTEYNGEAFQHIRTPRQAPFPPPMPVQVPVNDRMDLSNDIGYQNWSSNSSGNFTSVGESSSQSFNLDYFDDTYLSQMSMQASSPMDILQASASGEPGTPAMAMNIPKRKLSDKTAKEANMKAQTQAPAAQYKQHHRTNSRK